MSLGNLALAIICVAAALYVIVLITGMIAIWPFGIIGLVALGLCGFGLFRVVRDKLTDKENRHYEDNVNE